MLRIGVIGIIVTDKSEVPSIQEILSKYGEFIIGRMGVPDKELGISAISVIVKATVEQFSSLTGKLGKLSGVFVKSAISGYEG